MPSTRSLSDAFTYDDTFYCEPKDFSTLAPHHQHRPLGGGRADRRRHPHGLGRARSRSEEADHRRQVGLSFGAEYARIGVFMNQAGGSLVSEDGTTVTADTAENLAGLTQVQKMIKEGTLKFPSALDSGWSGEALGKGKAAMVIEGPWIKGALKGDFPELKYTAAELPAGPGGQSTFTFSNCWGIPPQSKTAAAAKSLVEALTADAQQLEFAKAFGVIPSTESAAKVYAETVPGERVVRREQRLRGEPGRVCRSLDRDERLQRPAGGPGHRRPAGDAEFPADEPAGRSGRREQVGLMSAIRA